MVTARELVAQASAILLDFDGPVLFGLCGSAGRSASPRRCARTSPRWIPRSTLDGTSGDPLDVLRAARNHSPEAGAVGEELLAAAELDAVTVAEPTEGATEFLEAMHQRGTLVAIVSNNGEQAIRAYLERQALAGLVAAISARDPSDARLMKPDPRSLTIAMARLGSDPATTVMIGDSASDMSAARAAEVRVVAYANKERKLSLLEDAEPDALITSMRALVD